MCEPRHSFWDLQRQTHIDPNKRKGYCESNCIWIVLLMDYRPQNPTQFFQSENFHIECTLEIFVQLKEKMMDCEDQLHDLIANMPEEEFLIL